MKRRGLLIDLTSLLDVILIVLFLVLTTSAAQAASATTELNEVNSQLQERVEYLESRQFEGTDSEQNWYQVYNENIGRIEVFFPDDLQTEAMRLIMPDQTEKKKPETDDVADWLTSAVADIKEKVVIITFNYRNDAIYWRDYTGLREILLKISDTSDKTIFYQEVPRK